MGGRVGDRLHGVWGGGKDGGGSLLRTTARIVRGD
jgi:hypothetical protein